MTAQDFAIALLVLPLQVLGVFLRIRPISGPMSGERTN
jgi:hypothetical protein